MGLDTPSRSNRPWGSVRQLAHFAKEVLPRKVGDFADDDYFYDVRITYDEASNITRVIDNVHIDPGAGGSGPGTHAFDAAYSIDGLNRVTRAHEGKWDTSSITTEYRDEQWILTQTGNWDRNKVDLNGNGNFTDAGELDDTRTHSPVNEILSRDLDSNPGTTGNNYDLSNSYNLRGDLEDDKQQYKYVWDAFGRLVEIRRQNSSLVAAYRYNGLNQRITWHYDATDNGTTDGSDPTYHFAYDEQWRIVGTWRDTDANLKEMFIYHNAGLAGRGGSSYIDTVVLRDRDMTNGWTGAADGTQEERHYYLQNWRGDVSAIFNHVGALVEWQKYSAYGVPYLITPGDHNKNGKVDTDDSKSFDEDYQVGNLRADLNKDGVVNSADQTLFNASYTQAADGGRWKLSSEDVGNRKGYAGYEHEGFGNNLAAVELAHVRNRVLHFGLGRWTRRDPLGYVDGTSLSEYCGSEPVELTDPTGLLSSIDTAVRACFTMPTIQMRIECLQGLMNIFPGTRWNQTLQRMIDGLKRRAQRPRPPSRITRGLTAECVKLYGIYKGAEAACLSCNPTSECAYACLNSACWSTALAFRKKYDNRCPAPYPGHKYAREQAAAALANCASRCATPKCVSIIDPGRQIPVPGGVATSMELVVETYEIDWGFIDVTMPESMMTDSQPQGIAVQ